MYGYLVEVETDKVNTLTDYLEKGIRYIGKAMQVAEEMCQGGSSMGYRNSSGMGYRSGRSSMGYLEEEPPMYDEYGNPTMTGEMGMRRMRDSRGRFM